MKNVSWLKEKEQVEKYHTKNLQAVIYFGQGLDALDAGLWKDAKTFFKKATEEDPEFALAKYYSDHCPGATVASLSTLTAMTVNQLASTVEEAVDEASAAQADVSQGQTSGGPSPESPDAGTTGGGSVSW